MLILTIDYLNYLRHCLCTKRSCILITHPGCMVVQNGRVWK